MLNNTMVSGDLRVTGTIYGNLHNFSGTAFYSGNQNTAEHDANNIQANGVYYYSSNGPATSLGAVSDGALYAQAYSSKWVGQIAQDYRTGNLFVRGRNNDSWTSWLRIPTADSKSVGSNAQPVYMADTGKLTACTMANLSVGSANYLTGFTSKTSSCSWGTLTTTNGYTFVTGLQYKEGTDDPADLVYAYKKNTTSDCRLYCQIDGCFYQQIGQYRVLDTSDVGSTVASQSHNHDSTYLKLTGGTMTGTINTPPDAVALNFRSDNGNYYTTASYQTGDNEALVFATTNAVTSFMFVNGENSVANHANNRWRSLTPGLQIKNNKVSIGKLIDTGVTPSYTLEVNGSVRGTTYNVNGACTMQYNSTTASLDFVFA